jgi:predicted Zn-dependent peptidase
LRRIQRVVDTDGLANGITAVQVDEPDMAIDVVRAGKGALPNALLVLAQRISMSDANEVWARHFRTGLGQAAKKAEPKTTARAQLMAALYPKHPYGHVIEAADYQKVSDEQLRAYLPMMHRPDNTTLVIAGDVETAHAEKLVRRRFGSWKGDDQAKPPRIPAAPEPSQEQHAPIAVAKDGSLQVEVTVGCRLPAANDPLTAARTLVIKSIIFSAYRKSLRSELGLSYATHVQPTLSQGGSHLLAETSIDADRFAEAWPVVESLWRRLQAGELTDEELRDAQRVALAANNLEVTGSSSIAWEVLSAVRNKWDPQTYDQFGSLINAADARAIRRDLAVCVNSRVTSLVGTSATIKSVKLTP